MKDVLAGVRADENDNSELVGSIHDKKKNRKHKREELDK
jgi:hypothetical protein